MRTRWGFCSCVCSVIEGFQGFHPPLCLLLATPFFGPPLRHADLWKPGSAEHRGPPPSQAFSSCMCFGRHRSLGDDCEQVLFLLRVLSASKNFWAETKLVAVDIWKLSDLYWRTWQGLLLLGERNSRVQALWECGWPALGLGVLFQACGLWVT